MFSMHDVYLFHGSKANNSGKRRAGLTYRYMPASSFYDHDGAKVIEDQNWLLTSKTITFD